MSGFDTSREKRGAAGNKNDFYPSEESISKSDILKMSGASGFKPLSPALKEKFEPSFGMDLSNVRLSEGHIPEELGIQAAAKGTDILMDSRAGMDVMGHELAHVVQQAQGRVQGGFPVVHNPGLEREADRMGERAASGLPAMENGMGSMGAMAAVAPMSEASAPVQCKSKEKKHRDAVVGSRGYKAKNVKKVPHELGSDTRMRQQMAGPMPAPAAAMQEAAEQLKRQADIFIASGLRSDKSEAAKAVRERRGNAYNGLSDDVKQWGMGLKKKGLDWGKISNEAINPSAVSGGPFSGQATFYGSQDISGLSMGAMDIFEQYLAREEIQQHLKERYGLLSGTEVFDEEAGNGTQLDFMMADLMNREFGIGATGSLRDSLKEDAEAQSGVTRLTSFLLKLPNIARDIDDGKIDQRKFDAAGMGHMLSAVARYKEMRGKIGQIVDPGTYDEITGGRKRR